MSRREFIQQGNEVTPTVTWAERQAPKRKEKETLQNVIFRFTSGLQLSFPQDFFVFTFGLFSYT